MDPTFSHPGADKISARFSFPRTGQDPAAKVGAQSRVTLCGETAFGAIAAGRISRMRENSVLGEQTGGVFLNIMAARALLRPRSGWYKCRTMA